LKNSTPMPLSRMEIKIASETLELCQVEHFLKEVFIKNDVKPDIFFKALLCVNEAVINSIIHGNKFNPLKQVRIQSYSCKRFLYFRISDQGDGFDYENLPDPTALENLKKETGRGIYIIKKISDRTDFRQKGSIIEFKIELGGDD